MAGYIRIITLAEQDKPDGRRLIAQLALAIKLAVRLIADAGTPDPAVANG